METLKIAEKFVASRNNSKACEYCKCFFQKMFHNQGWNPRCRPCAIERNSKEKDYNRGRDELITSTFKCPAEKCSTTTLLFKDFVMGTCCFAGYQKCSEIYKSLDAERQSLFDSEFGFKMLLKCKESKDEKNLRDLLNHSNTVLKSYFDQQSGHIKEMSDTKIAAFKAEEALHFASKACKDSEEKYKINDKKIEGMKKLIDSSMTEMRRMFATTQIRDLSRLECGICMEKFDNGEHAESVPHCGHRACAKCLKGLDPKICPACRSEFTDSHIIRIY